MPSGSQHYRDGRLHPENHQELLKCRRHVAHSGLPSELASFSTSSLCCSWDPAACCALSSSLTVKLELLTPSTHTRSAVHLQSRFRSICCPSAVPLQVYSSPLQSICSASSILHRQLAHSCCDDHLITRHSLQLMHTATSQSAASWVQWLLSHFHLHTYSRG